MTLFERSSRNVRLARQDELAAVDAVVGTVDWTRRDSVGVLVSGGIPEALSGAAILTFRQVGPATAVFRMRCRVLNTPLAEGSFSALIDFALGESARAAVSRLVVEHVPDEPHAVAALQHRGFRPVAATLHFQGKTETAQRVTAETAGRVLARFPNLRVLPLASCSAAELVALAATGIGALGLGVRALYAGDRDVLSSLVGSYGILIDGRLRGAIVATTMCEPAFIEMLAVERRYGRHGIAAVLLERCATAGLEAGVRTFVFTTSPANRPMCRLAARLQCRATQRTEVWEVPIERRTGAGAARA